MIHHYITHYIESGKHYAEAWIQVDVFGRCFCFWKKRIEVKHDSYSYYKTCA